MRVRTGRFEKLRSCEPGEAKVVEVFDREDAIQSCLAMTPPSTGSAGYQGRQLMGRPKRPEPAVSSRSRSPLFELNSPQPVPNP